MDDCIFCKIIKGEIPSSKVAENDKLIAFYDINPKAKVHILIVPKKHVVGLQDLSSDDGQLLADIYRVVNSLVKQYNLSADLYRVVVNGGRAQHVPHLHFHLLGGVWKKFI